MSDIRDWLFTQLLEQEERTLVATGTRPRIDVAIDAAVFAEAVAAADVRYGAIVTKDDVLQEIRLGHNIVIKPLPDDGDDDDLRAELDAALAEIKDLKAAVVTMCDAYSANRTEKMRVKAFRRHAADAETPFSLADVNATFEKLEQR